MSTIAYAADETVLLTFDGARLLAFDAVSGAAKWELGLPRALAGVVSASPNALAHDAPWRSGFSGSAVFAVDVRGRVHVVDATAGRLLVSIDAMIDKPVAIAAGLDVFAVAGAKGVSVWRAGARSEIAERATALAFSDDGKTLAIGTKRGDVIAVDVPTQARTFTQPLDRAIMALAWSARTQFLAGNARGLFQVSTASAKQLRAEPTRAIAVAADGSRIAIGGSERAILVPFRPGARCAPLAVVTVVRRSIVDLAFGPDRSIGLGVTRGDAAIVDVSRRIGQRVDRPDRGWTLRVDAPVELPVETLDARSPWTRIMLGAIIAGGFVALVFAGMVRTREDTHSFASSPASILRDMKCDRTCEASRLGELSRACSEQPAAECQADADAALASFEAAHCAEARASLAQIQTRIMTRASKAPTLVKAYLSLAQTGLDKTCVEVIAEPTESAP